MEYYPCFNYISQQCRMNERNRTDLINWLFEMQPDIKIQTVTVHVAINYIDRYLSQR